MPDLVSLRPAWENFYVVVGSSGAALIGVQFVVIALIANRRSTATAEAIHAFATPTVVHLGAALLISALVAAPWPTALPLAIALSLCGVGGLGYGAIVLRRAHRQRAYAPVWEDWIWYGLLPCSLYAGLALAGALLQAKAQIAMQLAAGATLGLLLIGIHNAWDTVTHIVVQDSRPDAAPH